MHSLIEKMLSKAVYRWLFTIKTGVLLVLSFPFTGSLFPLIFVALVPLLLVENSLKRTASISIFLHAYVAFFIYNLGVTWWVYNSSAEGGLMAFFANSLLMALAFLFYHRIKRKIGSHWQILLFASVWISFEFLHFNWELSWPWLTFGNVFADAPVLVQWYSITGVLGGSFWILLTNGIIAKYLIVNDENPWRKRALKTLIFVLVSPILVSLSMYFSKDTGGREFQVLVLQPNVDPYEKFNSSSEKQLNDLMDQINQSITPKTKLIIAPETALLPGFAFDEDRINREVISHLFREKRAGWNNADVLIGANTQRLFDEPNSHVSRFIPEMNQYYETYNSSLLFSNKSTVDIVHKSKLVLGVEKIPFSRYFPSLENLAIDLGGSSGTLGIEEDYEVMQCRNTIFTPSVCYESIYGEFVAKQTKKGSGFIAIITNDGWWGNTPGHRQHFELARLRAIENNKYVVRSANTGISGVINNRGDVVKKTEYWKKDAFATSIYTNESKTIYQYLGDFIAYFALIATVLFYIMRWVLTKKSIEG